MVIAGVKGKPANVTVGWILENKIPHMTTAFVEEHSCNETKKDLKKRKILPKISTRG
jgi:hypothetical protein